MVPLFEDTNDEIISSKISYKQVFRAYYISSDSYTNFRFGMTGNASKIDLKQRGITFKDPWLFTPDDKNIPSAVVEKINLFCE